MILAIDTAGPVVGVALSSAPGVLEQSWSARITRGADTQLAPQVQRMAAGVTTVAVSVGPGAFTSLRVGVSLALGLAVARGCDVVPYGSLRARALGHTGSVLVLLDGRKGRAYAARFQDGQQVGEAVDVPPDTLLADPCVATGEGALVWQERFRAAGFAIDPDAGRSPAAAMALDAWSRRATAVPPQAVVLDYIRPPDAKLPR